MRRATLEDHYWHLESGEARHLEYGDAFWIPAAVDRQQLRRGQAAKLLFQIEAEGADGIELTVERMWVIVAEQVGEGYIGILDNQPASLEPGPHVYLTEGAEVPFWPEHVIDLDEPPAEWIEHRLGQPPSRRWPRDDDQPHARQAAV